jgi:arginyl-tRNA synthetase
MGFKEDIYRALDAAVKSAGYATDEVRLVLEKPRFKEHGDICTPIALSLAKVFKKSPMEIAVGIAGAAGFPEGTVASIDVAKPGYVNLRFAPPVLMDNLADIIDRGEEYGSSDLGKGKKCQVEYVSANPTGPLVIVSARAAAVGSAIVNLYRHIGFDAEGEYYVNDYGNQVDALGRSLQYRYREKAGTLDPGEEMGDYPGEYLKTIAERITPEQALEWDKHDDGGVSRYGAFATEELLGSIKADLEYFGVHFDNFFRESTLHPERVENARRLIEEKGFSLEKDGALYLETTRFGDEKDRVLVKSDGKPTYFLGDIAYHMTKFERGYDWVVDLLGPDHHGHIPRMAAAARVIGAGESWFQSLVVGWVRLTEGKKPISMSKRAGEFITMRELIDDVGSDVAKYFFLMRRTNTPLDFDLELARKQSDENPVYYVQYAHARIASVTRFAGEKGVGRNSGAPDPGLLESDEERDLMVHLMYFPYEVEGAALSREPHRLTTYAKDLATLFHQFYHAHRIVTDDEDVSAARLYLAEATMQVLRNTLHLLGVSAPHSM